MAHYVAFLRAVNVGGRNVKSVQLVTAFESCGLQRVTTFLASGNVLFSSGTVLPGNLRQDLEAAIEQSSGFKSEVFIVSANQLADMLEGYPYNNYLDSLPTHCIGFCDFMSPEQKADLAAFATETDLFTADAGVVYWASANRQSEPAFTLKQLEKVIGKRITFRGLNTISRLCLKLSAMLAD